MTCSEFQARLGELLDGELPAQSAASAAAHRDSCAACRREWDCYAALRERLHRWPAASASPNFEPVLYARLWERRRMRHHGRRRLLWLIPAAASAALAILLGLPWLASNPATPPASVPTVTPKKMPRPGEAVAQINTNAPEAEDPPTERARYVLERVEPKSVWGLPFRLRRTGPPQPEEVRISLKGSVWALPNWKDKEEERRP